MKRLIAVALLVAGCQASPVSPSPTTRPTSPNASPVHAPSASPVPTASQAVPGLEVVDCVLAVTPEGVSIPGDADCRGSDNVQEPPGSGSYHVTDLPRQGQVVSFSVDLKNAGTAPTGPLTVLITSAHFDYIATFPAVACKPKCLRGEATTGLQAFEWKAGVAPGASQRFTASYRATKEGRFYYQVAVYATSIAGYRAHWPEWFRDNSAPIVIEWDDVQSVVSAK